jgi:diguanylate cyclase (GGDEF)-like protein
MKQSSDKERLRLAAVRSYRVLDTPPEPAFDRITRLARDVFDVPIALVSLVDEHRQWFKSHPGIGLCETAREGSFCNHAIEEEDVFLIPNALVDPRFWNSPLVVDAPYIRSYFAAALRSPDGYNIGTLCILDTRERELDARQIRILRDLAQLVMSELDLRRQATTDLLTSVLSRRGFFDAAAANIASVRRHGRDLSCILVDIDHFKAINDTHGHATGDLALREIAKAMRAVQRAGDTLGRIGGEEFAIILPEAGSAAALKIGERLRRRVMSMAIPVAEGEINLTVSIGVATLNGEDTGIEDLLNRADVALYAAKAAGRNRLMFENQPTLAAAG